MSNRSTIYITRDDHAKLRLLLSAVSVSRGGQALNQLSEELDRAILVHPSVVPPGVVTLESRVEYQDVDTGEIEEYTITFPERANIEEKRISILAPIGIALIGCRVGDIVRWATPGGIRRLKLRRTTQPSLPPSLVFAEPLEAAGAR